MSRRARAPRVRPGDAELAIDPLHTERILTGFIREEVGRAGFSQVVLGLSGGVDSAVVASLAARALGQASVHALLMPHRASHPHSVRDAETVLGALGLMAEKIDITAMADAFGAVVGDVGAHRMGNIVARARMILLYDRSAEHGALVLGTSNKTELLLGYGTLHGDLASAVNPIGDLYKTQVRALAEHLQVPRAVRQKAPSADLRENQTDEADLGFTYDEVDRLLALLVDARMGRGTVIQAGFAPTLVDRVWSMVVRSQFKRRMPVVAKVSTRSVGWDFRYPRDWRS